MEGAEIQIGSKVSQVVACTGCQKEIVFTDAHTFKGKDNTDLYYCAECKAKLDQAFKAETEQPNLAGALGLGLLAGIASGVVWYFVETISGYQIGYLALGAGYLVGLAVIRGSGGKRGSALQLISVVITLLAIVGASYLSKIHLINQYLAEQGSSVTGSGGFLWVSPFNPEMMKALFSPMGLLIWAIALYIAFRVPQARKL